MYHRLLHVSINSRPASAHLASALPLHPLLPSVHAPPDPQRPSPRHRCLLPGRCHCGCVKRHGVDAAGGGLLFHLAWPGPCIVCGVPIRWSRWGFLGFHPWPGWRSCHPRILVGLSWFQRWTLWVKWSGLETVGDKGGRDETRPRTWLLVGQVAAPLDWLKGCMAGRREFLLLRCPWAAKEVGYASLGQPVSAGRGTGSFGLA